jgi:hypothetical protein
VPRRSGAIIAATIEIAKRTTRMMISRRAAIRVQ